MTTPHAALLPCPFCGGDVSEVTPPGSSVWIECGSCRCKTTRYSAIEGARIAWNRRATSAIAALDAYLASPQPGWVAVPVKPTDAMLDALYAEGDFTSYDGMLSCWRSMLDNLPAPPGQHQGAAPDGAQPPAWVTSWPEWCGVFGNVKVVPKDDYDRVCSNAEALTRLFKKATGYTVEEYKAMVKELKDA